MADSDKKAAWERYKQMFYEQGRRAKRADMPEVSEPSESSEEPNYADAAAEVAEDVRDDLSEKTDDLGVPEELVTDVETAEDISEPVTDGVSGEVLENVSDPDNFSVKTQQPGSDFEEIEMPLADMPAENVPEGKTGEETAAEPDEGPEKERSLKKFYNKYKLPLDIAIVVILTVFDFADMYGISKLAGKNIPPLSDRFFSFMKLDTIDPVAWNADVFKKVLCGLTAFLIAGFISFLIQISVSKLMRLINRKVLSGVVTAVLPFIFCGIALFFAFRSNFDMANISSLGAMVGGLFFLLLAKFSLEIPVDSVKTEKKED